MWTLLEPTLTLVAATRQNRAGPSNEASTVLNKKVTWFASKKVSNQPFAMVSTTPVALLQVRMAVRVGGQLG